MKRVIWRFQIYNLFLEIFKFREDKTDNVFREILKCFRKTAKFEFFAKQIQKNFKLLEHKHIIYHYEAGDQEIPNLIICFSKYLNFAKIKPVVYFAKFLNAFVKPRNLNFSRNKLYI